MWHSKKLTLSGDAASINCSLLSVNPWTPGAGRREASGCYLSPENAIRWATDRLSGAPANLDVTALLMSAPTLSLFASALASAAGIFPVAQLTQTRRRAVAEISLAETRMQLPALVGGLPAASTLSISTLRQATGAQALISAAGVTLPSIDEAMASFKAQRLDLLAQAQRLLEELTAGSLPVKVVSAIGDTAGAVREMLEQTPDADHVFSLCLVFAGEDLSALRGMLGDG
ncbi:hypothetical protein EKN38_25430 [Enterobacter sp. WCHEn045836]|uniref:hypothetical protein n=1 Tax=Enterobacter sp. WCHEn045836 TaxID=2497434 RepID=UPI000F81EBE3|nr:hypothetical protein [Enterobacter sp. WCHEn045836]RTP93090.1 hypothetical protein EKN38_25430 [Enterobacter sp. WCHEn045836]